MNYTFEQLKEDVRKEAVALKQNATKEELRKLDFVTLNSRFIDQCIYGQMCELCRTPRAIELIKSCCVKYVKNEVFFPGSGIEWNKVIKNPNQVAGMEAGLTYISAIEAYIMLPEARNANLIAYLRGETETLEL